MLYLFFPFCGLFLDSNTSVQFLLNFVKMRHADMCELSMPLRFVTGFESVWKIDNHSGTV